MPTSKVGPEAPGDAPYQGWVELEERSERKTTALEEGRRGARGGEPEVWSQTAVPTLAPRETWGRFLPLL